MTKKNRDSLTLVDMHQQYADKGEMYSSKLREVNLNISSNLRMLCAILDVKVEKLLSDFIWMLSFSNHDSATDRQRKIAKKFFLIGKYGQPFYTKKRIKQMFDELMAERNINDTIGTIDYEDRALLWENNHMYVEYWFKRWFELNRNKGDISILEKY